jgi:hypothetical protein
VCSLAWDFPRGGDAHAGVLAAVWFTPLLINPDVVAGCAVPPGRCTERHS